MNLLQAARRFAVFSAGLTFLAGFSALMGWQLGVSLLTTLPPGKIAMNPLTAINFSCLGIGLWLTTYRRRPWLVRAIALAVTLTAAARFLGFWGWDLALDRLFYLSELGDNRMAPNTALCFALCGLSLLFQNAKSRFFLRPGDLFVTLSLTASLFALTGYFYGVGALYSVSTFTPMALNTGITFFIFSLGLFASRPDEGVGALYTSRDLGGTAVRSLLPIVVGVPLLCGAVFLYGQRSGWYSHEVGVSLLVVCVMLVLAVTTWGLSTHMGKMDRALKEQSNLVEKTLKENNEDLERKIQERMKDLTKAESQIQQLQKLDAIGRLAGGIAHDYNNILGALQMYSDFMADKISDAKALKESLEEVNKVIDRGAGLTRQLLVFGRSNITQKCPVDVNELLSEHLKMLTRLIGENFRIDLRLNATSPIVEADPGQLEQVTMNLVINARDAMSAGGTIIIESKNESIDGDHVDMYLSPHPGSYVMLSVADTGCGMDEKTRTRIFEPFFTTKAIGKGTGLGLSTVFGIVKNHEGGIWLDSIPGKSTVFKIYFPASAEQLMATEATAAPQELRGQETILLVEDEQTLRNLFAQTLEDYGYRILRAENGMQALKLIQTAGDTIDLVITDMIMPELDGARLSREILRHHPSLRILCISGHPGDEAADVTAQTDLLQKPFNRRRLLEKVREVLDRDQVNKKNCILSTPR